MLDAGFDTAFGTWKTESEDNEIFCCVYSVCLLVFNLSGHE